jgi:hypothetical protein
MGLRACPIVFGLNASSFAKFPFSDVHHGDSATAPAPVTAPPPSVVAYRICRILASLSPSPLAGDAVVAVILSSVNYTQRYKSLLAVLSSSTLLT